MPVIVDAPNDHVVLFDKDGSFKESNVVVVKRGNSTAIKVFPNPVIKNLVLPLMSYVENKTFSYASHINLISGGFKDYFKKEI